MRELMKYLDEQIERIQSVIDNNRKPIPFDKLGAWDRRCWNRDHTGKDDVFVNETDYNNAPFNYNDYSEETIDKLKDALRSIVITQTYLKQVDKLLGDDIGEDDFVENLISNLKDIVYICD